MENCFIAMVYSYMKNLLKSLFLQLTLPL